MFLHWFKGVEQRLDLCAVIVWLKTPAECVVKLVVDQAELPSSQPPLGDGRAVVLFQEVQRVDRGVATRIGRSVWPYSLFCLETQFGHSTEDGRNFLESSVQLFPVSLFQSVLNETQEALKRYRLP